MILKIILKKEKVNALKYYKNFYAFFCIYIYL